MNTNRIHEYKQNTWIQTKYMNTNKIHEYKQNTWIQTKYMDTNKIHEYKQNTWIQTKYNRSICMDTINMFRLRGLMYKYQFSVYFLFSYL